METTHEEIWGNCLKVIRDNVNLQSFKTWFAPIKPVSLDGKVLTIQVPSLFFYEWLEEHYVSLLRKTICRELGEGAKLEYSIVVENSSKDRKRPSTINMPAQSPPRKEKMEVSMPEDIGSTIKNPFVIPGLKKVDVDPQLNQHFTFEGFVEGECNRLARSAGQAIANNPGGTSFNPFLIYGGVGLGKTHLAHAIGNMILGNDYKGTVLQVEAEKFTNQFIDSIKNHEINDFINFYQMIDVLIIEDIQFFANKGKTQDIFFHIFNHLHQKNKQLILTSDRPPSELKNIEERLISRFKWGLSADLRLPDFETRLAILKYKMFADGIELSDDVVEYVAHNITTNVRELEGALISLLAHASLNKEPLDLSMTRNILRSFVKDKEPRQLSIDEIQKMVGEYFSVDVDLICSKVRKRPIVKARHLSMYFSKMMTRDSLSKIGHSFGGRDHSTVIHACQTVNNMLDTDPEFRRVYEELKRKIEVNLGE